MVRGVAGPGNIVIWYILGTRPELIKAFPVVQQLREEGRKVLVLSTGQHTSLAEGMPLVADDNLRCPGQDDPYVAITQMLTALHQYANERPLPAWIVVQGDTSSAVAGARFAESRNIPLLHIEAGLRSHDVTDPWPEEGFRVEIDRLATKKACPTEGNYANLVREGLQKGAEVTGNPITDALRLMGSQKQGSNHVLVTLHRRESFGRAMADCAKAIFRLAKDHPDLPFLWPMHPNPHVTEALHGQQVPANVTLCSPMPYRSFLIALEHSACVITDSGGLIEECTTLGVPCLIARNTTERPEALGQSRAMLVQRNGSDLEAGFRWAQSTHITPSPIFGDGCSAPRITRMLA